MSRVLITWELGLHLGHLARILPVAVHLQAQGHQVLIATRDIPAAVRVLAPARIPFIQAPHLPNGLALPHRPAGYADILLSQGWLQRSTLQGLTHAWLNLFRLFNPTRLILDYSPTVSLAARIARIHAVSIGNGFELPPDRDPLPAFPDFPWTTTARAAESEALSVRHANAVLAAYGAAPIAALRDLFSPTRLLATFPELDHYGARHDGCYIGPLLGALQAPRLEWPAGEGPRIFASLRPDTTHAQAILTALAQISARVICVAGGFEASQLAVFNKSHIRFSLGPVDLTVLGEADLCLTYGAEGTMMRFLLMGVPQLLSPWHVETFMAARRVAAAGLGAWLSDEHTPRSIADLVYTLTMDRALSDRVKQFASRSAALNLDRVCSLTMGADDAVAQNGSVDSTTVAAGSRDALPALTEHAA